MDVLDYEMSYRQTYTNSNFPGHPWLKIIIKFMVDDN